jgi:2-oxoglutarate ferredoxin oxidoreductase subunit delta
MARVTFREERCKGCGNCIQVCPKKIITFAEKLNDKGYHPVEVTEERMGQCTACTACARMCPDCVIVVER